jgi:uncharacterized SAM-binding protein YcdF (DUF218 family)
MFFILSKLLVFIISPLVWIVTLLLLSFFTGYPNRKKKYLGWAIVFTLFFSNAFVFDEFARVWETPATRYEDLQHYEAGIVLGGMSVYNQSIDRAQFFRGVDRLIQAVELYKRGIIKKIIFTGGSGRLLHPEMQEGNYINRYLLYMGVPEKDFLIEGESQNTRENAVFTKQLLETKQVKGDLLLITSAIHMRRSLGCFNKVGINATPYSTDCYSGPRKFEFDHVFIPEPSVLYNWTTLLHEVVGYITYKLAGYA